MVVACLALLVALGGVGYATTVLPADSVGTREVRNGSLLREDFKAGQLPPPASTPSRSTLNAQVGPGATIAVRTRAGVKVSRVRVGQYEIRVSDRSRTDNFHLTGQGIDRRTRASFVGSAVWNVRLVRGAYRFRSDAHARMMSGTFEVA